VMNKVYCSDCKWNKLFWNIWEGCFLITGYETRYNRRKKVIRTNEEAMLKNRDNNCSDYKRKWWKFWR